MQGTMIAALTNVRCKSMTFLQIFVRSSFLPFFLSITKDRSFPFQTEITTMYERRIYLLLERQPQFKHSVTMFTFPSALIVVSLNKYITLYWIDESNFFRRQLFFLTMITAVIVNYNNNDDNNESDDDNDNETMMMIAMII